MHSAAEAEDKQKAAEEEKKKAATEAAAGCNPHTINIAVCLHLHLQL
jgi:hypothetical protein